MFKYYNNTERSQLVWVEPWAFELNLLKGQTISIWHKNGDKVFVEEEFTDFDGVSYMVFNVNSFGEIEYNVTD